jgi:CheY-like chemotaxis protein
VCLDGGERKKDMILLVTTSPRAREAAAAVEQGTGHKTHLASTVPQALSRLQAAEYDCLAVDQSLLEVDFRALDTLMNRCGMAMPAYINLALHSVEREVREITVALRRQESERLLAMRSAERTLSNQLRGNLTGILLNSELALRQKSISADVAEKVQAVRELAEKMRDQLGGAQ